MQFLSVALIGIGLWLASRHGDCEKSLRAPVFVIAIFFLLCKLQMGFPSNLSYHFYFFSPYLLVFERSDPGPKVLG